MKISISKHTLRRYFSTLAGFDRDIFITLKPRSMQHELIFTVFLIFLSVTLVWLSTFFLVYKVTLSYLYATPLAFVIAGVGLFIAREVNIGRQIPPSLNERPANDEETIKRYSLSWQRGLLMVSWGAIFSIFLTLFIIEFLYTDELHEWVAQQYLNYLQTPLFINQQGFQREEMMLTTNLIKLYNFSFTTHFTLSSLIFLIILAGISSPALSQFIYPDQLMNYKRILHRHHRAMIKDAYDQSELLIRELLNDKFNAIYEPRSAYLDPPYNTILKPSRSIQHLSHEELFDVLDAMQSEPGDDQR